MAEFRLERFKYNWRGTWQPGTSYKRDDVVRVNGKSYVCIITHASSPAFRTDLTAILPGSNPPQPQPRWTVMTSGRSFEGEWVSSRDYNIGDIVTYNGSLWACIVPHQSTNFATNFSNWEIFAQTTSFVGNWQSNTTYAPGAVVKYNGNAYKCIDAHVSGNRLELNQADWELYHEGIEVRNAWSPNTEYRLNDLVKYGGTVFRCIETHTSNGTNLDDTKFVLDVLGTQYNGDWSNTVYYNVGDIVRHRGFMYYAVRNNVGSRPYVDNGSSDWILLARSYSFVGPWSISAEYKTGDIVLRGGNLYLAVRDIAGGQTVDGSTLDYLEGDTWELLVPGKSWKSNWTSGTNYKVGDVVYFKGSAYTCNFEHDASIQNFPGDNGNIFNYWDLLIQAGREGGLKERGDILTYGLSRVIDQDGSTAFDDSTLGDVRLAIGEREQVLSVTNNLEVYWRDIVQNAESVYVTTNGIDDDDRGTAERPFKTIRYAAEYAEDTFPPGTPVIIRVSTGRFEEISPIIVPAGCAVHGDELRSTTVIATGPIAGYQNDFQYVQEYLDHLLTILLNLVTGVTVTPTPGNTETQITTILVPSRNPTSGEIEINPNTGEPILIDIFPRSNLVGSNAVVNLFDDFVNYVAFRVESGDNNPTVTGSNILNSDQTIANAGLALAVNKKFITSEIIAFLRAEHPNVQFDEMKIKNDVWSLIRGVREDLKYSGNYRILTAARRYANAVTGCQLEDLFLMRDSTGLRDLTTEGLRGTLNPPGVFDLYQKPTGGACVSLDAGWGPADTRVWITNRSPYIQGVTNIGTGCVGKKVDGSLHNGGNRSMVSNDFTQVLSDGIGVWVTNNGRTELVSVFTYYCQIGYFAEDGGVIRATNGNNSYGKYGSIADGADQTEVPQNATLMNRNNEAIVLEAFAGGPADELFIFEYSNTGEDYTQATASIQGAGANASVEYTDFRDGAIFEARLVSADGSSSKSGSGYLVRQGSAQETLGASNTIKLAATDNTQQLSEIDGMRLIITDGTGVGQYGYVSNFDFITKTVTVRRESTDTLGWDHIIPGTPIATDLDLTTRYRIEPRISISPPPFSATAYPLVTNRSYTDVAYGNTTETFNNITSSGRYVWEDSTNNAVTVNQIISDTAIQFNGTSVVPPTAPFTIQGRTSGTTTNVTAITANTGLLLEANVLDSEGFIVGERLDIVLTAGTGNTFDDDPVPAVFNITRSGQTYSATLVSGGAGYSVNNKIVIPGNVLGGSSPENDATIIVNSVSQDSTNGILTFSISGKGRKGKFVSLTNSEYARYSEDGINWTELSLPFISSYRRLINGNNRFIAIANDESRVAFSLTGESWTTASLPFAEGWVDGTFGGGRFVIIANDSDRVLSSTNGTTWAPGIIPNDTVGDSTISQWTRVAYGKGRYVVVSANDRATATSTNATSWTRNDQALPSELTGTITALEYGNNRFLVVTATGKTAYSFDGVTWYMGTDVGITNFAISRMKYSQGVFVAVGTISGTTATNLCATTEDGIRWSARTLASTQQWSAVTYGDSDGDKVWVMLASAASTNGINIVSVGKQAILRGDVVTGGFRSIKIWDPGSGYSSNSLPMVTIVDPNNISNAAIQLRVGNGSLAQPEFINRGAGYRKETSIITISGNGYADIIPEGSTITLAGVENIPGPGVQIRIAGILDPTTDAPDDLFVFSGVEVFDLGDDGSGDGTRLVRFTITPSIGNENARPHGTAVTLRERYSQCRITGHDFLDIGTGNFEETNYPDVYASGNFFVAAPENEVFETNGGRVFYTSTDQDGNFRTGELFSVSQATGVVTISAQFFDLNGLSELSLGGVRLGGSGTVVNEFSTDSTFAADSNNVIPTQRAIATFIANRLSVGGENLEVNRLQAGRVVLGGEGNVINNSAGQYLKILPPVRFEGTYEVTVEGVTSIKPVQVSGTIVSQILLLKRFDQSMQ